MSDDLQSQEQASSGGSKIFVYVMAAIGILYVAVSAFLLADMHNRVEKLEGQQVAQDKFSAELQKDIHSRLSGTRSELKADTAALASQVGLTQKQLAQKAAALKKDQEDAEQRLSEQQKQEIGAVTGEVAGVKSDVGSVKTEVASTKTELEATKLKLERTIGDLGQQSGLIAKTRDELDYLKHRGDRNYYEFAITRKQKRTPVGTVSLELKKADAKKGKYTLEVMADDKTIEKKDKNVNEPVQFYSGKERQLFELVVFNIDKDKVTGYLSTPKNAAVPVDIK